MNMKIAYSRFKDKHGSPLASFVCAFKGHRYPPVIVTGFALHFCKRCGKEILGRTIDEINNLPPMPEDIRGEFEQLDEINY